LPFTESAAALIDGNIGELTRFHETFRIYAHAVSPETATLPADFKDRLVESQIGTARVRCLAPIDLAYSKLAAGREKDLQFMIEFPISDSRSSRGSLRRHEFKSPGTAKNRWYSPNQVENPVRFQLRAGFGKRFVILPNHTQWHYSTSMRLSSKSEPHTEKTYEPQRKNRKSTR
jgi:hypothetical protein